MDTLSGFYQTLLPYVKAAASVALAVIGRDTSQLVSTLPDLGWMPAIVKVAGTVSSAPMLQNGGLVTLSPKGVRVVRAARKVVMFYTAYKLVKYVLSVTAGPVRDAVISAIIDRYGSTAHVTRQQVQTVGPFNWFRRKLLQLSIDQERTFQTYATYRVDLRTVQVTFRAWMIEHGYKQEFDRYFASQLSHMQNCDRGSAYTKLIKIADTMPHELNTEDLHDSIDEFVNQSALFAPVDFST